jgi:hypothetical protein
MIQMTIPSPAITPVDISSGVQVSVAGVASASMSDGSSFWAVPVETSLMALLGVMSGVSITAAVSTTATVMSGVVDVVAMTIRGNVVVMNPLQIPLPMLLLARISTTYSVPGVRPLIA